MPCYRPIVAFRPLDGGPILFHEKKNCRQVVLPCGRCIGCRIRIRESWATRIFCESKMHADNAFVTLTYNEDCLPRYGGLDYRDFQLFAKRLRKAKGPFRFFVAGEYGEDHLRPHWHVLLFGLNFDDRVKCNSLHSRSDLYRSPELEKLWTKGFSSIGELNYTTARYCASYVISKRSPDDVCYERFDPVTGEVVTVPREFARMSLKPGLGFSWLEKYWKDIYETSYFGVPIDGGFKPVPSYFNDKLDSVSGVPKCVVDWFDFQRERKAHEFCNPEDQSYERLAVREEVAHSREAFNNLRRSS